MTKQPAILATCLLLVLFGGMMAFARTPESSSPDQQLIAAAQAELSKVLQSVPDEMLANYGFQNRPEIGRAVIGTPYHEIFFPQMKLSGRIRLLVRVDGEPRALLGMVWKDGGWRFADLGAARLAAELGQVEKKQLVEPAYGEILRDLELKNDFVRYEAGIQNSTLIPLQSARRAYQELTQQRQSSELLHRGLTLAKILELRARLLERAGLAGRQQ